MHEFTGRHADRDKALCAYYELTGSTKATAERFCLGRQRILQILKKASVYKPLKKTDRTLFLGIHVNKQTKEGLTALAARQFTSVSELAADVLERKVQEAQQP